MSCASVSFISLKPYTASLAYEQRAEASALLGEPDKASWVDDDEANREFISSRFR